MLFGFNNFNESFCMQVVKHSSRKRKGFFLKTMWSGSSHSTFFNFERSQLVLTLFKSLAKSLHGSEFTRIYPMWMRLRTPRMSGCIRQRNGLNQQLEPVQWIKRRVYPSSAQGSLTVYVHEPKLMFRLILANTHAMRLRT